MNTILGFKKEMTQVFDGDGKVVPVTLVDVSGCRVVGIVSKEKSGYDAVKLGIGERKNPTMPEAGKYKGIKIPRFVFEVHSNEAVEIGMKVSSDIFKSGDFVDVVGISKGKGFAGVIKRWGFSGTGSRTHGQSTKPRHPGSIGAGTNPGRVLKGKKMAGRMGGDRVTVKNVKVIMVDGDVVCLKGAIPGATNSVIYINRVK